MLSWHKDFSWFSDVRKFLRDGLEHFVVIHDLLGYAADNGVFSDVWRVLDLRKGVGKEILKGLRIGLDKPGVIDYPGVGKCLTGVPPVDTAGLVQVIQGIWEVEHERHFLVAHAVFD